MSYSSWLVGSPEQRNHVREGKAMIKYFSALYAGHVLEGDGIGFNGTPADDRWYPN